MMYQDKKRNRLLLVNGISMMEPEHYAQALYEQGESLPYSVRIPECSESEIFECLSGIKIGYNIDDFIPDDFFLGYGIPDPYTMDHITGLVCGNLSITSHRDPMVSFRRDRYGDTIKENGFDAVTDRMSDELCYFFQSPRPDIIASIIYLLNRFLEDGVVWGVGRGSSCSSLVFYLIGVHDVDPLKYDLPFSELTKEQSNAY